MKHINKLTLFSSLLLASSALAAAPLETSTGFVYPANKAHVDSDFIGFGDRNSSFGNRCHLADDYDLPEGSPVFATADGRVRQASTVIPYYGGSDGSLGTAMIVEHRTSGGEVFYGLYGHIRNMSVAVGDKVTKGQQIAQVGRYTSGGRSLPHLHFGINTEAPSYHGYTPTTACVDTLGFVDPEKFMLANHTAQGSCNAVDNEVTTTQNTAVFIPNVLANDTDVDDDPLILLSADVTSKNGVPISNNGDGTFRYTPAIDFKGADSFKYRISDEKGCTDIATVYINVTEPDFNGGQNGGETNSGGGGSFNIFGITGLLLLLFTRRFRKKGLIKQ